MKSTGSSFLLMMLLIAVTGFHSACPACSASGIDDDYAFASQLIATEDYDDAILFLRRYVLFSDEGPRQLCARFVIGSLYAKLNRHDRAVPTFLEIMSDPDTDMDIRENAAFLAIQSMFLGNDPAGFHVNLDKLEDSLGQLSIEGRIKRQYMKGFLGVYAGSRELADLLPVDTNLEPIASHSVDLKHQFDFWESRHIKQPVTAAILSTVIPGAGQFYNERYWDGAVALGIVGGGAYWSSRLFDRGDDHWGWTVGVITGLLYLGQIRNAMIDSVRINEKAELEFKQNLVSDYFLKFTLSVKQDDISFGIAF